MVWCSTQYVTQIFFRDVIQKDANVRLVPVLATGTMFIFQFISVLIECTSICFIM